MKNTVDDRSPTRLRLPAPEARYWLLAAALLGGLSLAQVWAQGPSLRKSEGEVVLENAHLRATLDPVRGGALVSLRLKADGAEMLSGPSFQESNILVGRRIQDLKELAFEVSNERQTGAMAGITLSAKLLPAPTLNAANLVGRAWDSIVWHPKEALLKPPFEKVLLSKRFRLGTDAVLRIEYELANTADEPVTLCLGTSLGLAGRRLNLPTREGAVEVHVPFEVKDRRLVTLLKAGNTWLHDMPESWVANYLPGGAGAVTVFESRHISFMRVNSTEANVTFARTRITVPPGQSFRSRVWIMPLRGLKVVQGAGAELAAAFDVRPAEANGKPALFRRTYVDEMLKAANLGKEAATALKPEDGGEEMADEDFEEFLEDDDDDSKGGYRGPAIKAGLTLLAARPRDVEVVFRLRRNLASDSKKIRSVRQRLSAGEPTRFSIDVKPAEEGIYILEAQVLEKGKAVSRFEHPLVAGRPKRFYLPGPGPKEGEINEDYCYEHQGRGRAPIRWDWEPTMKVESPHIKFARPLAGGALRALVVTPYGRARDVVEVAQRIELDYDVLTMDVWDYSRSVKTLAPMSQVDRLKELLNKRHDLIVFGTFMAQRFPMDVMEEVVRQVEEEGAGLICTIGCDYAGSLAEYLKLAEVDEDFRKPNAKFVEAGNGRIVFFEGSDLELRTCWASQNGRPTESDHERFVRAMLWAAGREPVVRLETSGFPRLVERSALTKKALEVRVKNTGEAPFRGKLRIIPRLDLVAGCRYYDIMETERRPYLSWQDWGQIEQNLKLAPGQTDRLSFQLPPLPQGAFDVDLSVTDERNAVVNWQRLPLTITHPYAIREVHYSDEHGNPITAPDREGRFSAPLFSAAQGGQLNVRVVCGGKGSADRMEVIGSDVYGRTIYRQERPLEKRSEAGQEARFQIPLRAAYHRVLELKLRVHDGLGCLQERRALGLIEPRPERRPAFGWITYSPDSNLRHDITGYDSRHRGFVAIDDILKHAWCDMHMTGLFSPMPQAQSIILPGDERVKSPEITATTDLTKPDEDEKDPEAEFDPKEIDYKKGYIRVPCLSNPRWRKAAIGGLESYFRTRGYYSRPFDATMGDEFFYTKELLDHKEVAGFRRQFILSRDGNICRSEHCLKRFRSFIKEMYAGDLDRLNQVWRTSYKSWEEVDPPLLTRNRVKVSKSMEYVDLSTGDSRFEEKCPPEEKWPHVIDHRRFTDHLVAGVIIEMRQAAGRGSPSARLGWGDLMGDTSMWNGLDAYLLAPHMDFNGLDHEENIWRSLGHPSNSHFVGYSKQYSRIRESVVPWWMMFRGNTAIGNWCSGEYPRHLADHTFFPSARVAFDTMREIRENGFDRLIVGRRYNDPVAILYDPRSIYASEMQEWKKDQERFFRNMAIGSRSHTDTCKKVEQSYARLLAEHYLQYYTVGYGHLEEGQFGQFGRPKVLFLPYTQCLSDAQARTLEGFVKGGGILIGDVHTGFRDEHGRRREKGILNHVFGIRQTAHGGMRVRKDATGKSIPVSFGKECGGPYRLGFEAVGPGDVAATTARPLAGFKRDGEKCPAFLVNEFGAGKAIYLNFLPAGYHEVVGDITEGDEATGVDDFGAGAKVKQATGDIQTWFRKMFATILGLSEVKDPIACDSYPTIYRFGEGDIEYLGLEVGYKHVARWEKPYELRVPRKRHLYDMRAGKYLGYTDQIRAQFDPLKLYLNALYALLPYKLEATELKIEAAEVARGGTLRFSVRTLPEVSARARHVISFRLLNPAGEEVKHYGSCLATENGAAAGRVDFALNDPVGTWAIKVRDAATAVSAAATFAVK